MKKLVKLFFYLFFFVIFTFITILSTIGIETNRFNSILSKKITDSNKNIELSFNTIKFKLDIKEINLFLESIKPEIKYRKHFILAKNLKIYVDFFSLIKSSPKINKIELSLEELDIEKVKKFSPLIKPSNLKNLVTNNIYKGMLNLEIEFYFNQDNKVDNFITRGKVFELSFNIKDNILFENSKFSFFADKSDILINNISGKANGVDVEDGDLKIILSPKISLVSNFETKINLNNSLINQYIDFYGKNEISKSINELKANLINNLELDLDNTYKLKKFNLNTRGKINKIDFNFSNSQMNLINKELKTANIRESSINFSFSPKKITTELNGKYSLNNKN